MRYGWHGYLKIKSNKDREVDTYIKESVREREIFAGVRPCEESK